uniref:Odorant receptor n=1 Tax=Campoletis chlorideae TaxID=219166 RepID=A0A346D431_9HYME|nr:odorant receptor [Campoletis chlorideae]
MRSFFDHRYYKWNKIFLACLGEWPEQSLFMRCLMPFVVCANVMSLVAVETLYVINVWPNLDVFLEWLPAFCVLIISCLQLLNCSFQHKKFIKILEHIYSDWQRFRITPHIKILHKYAARGCWLTKTYFRWMYSACLCYLTMPLVMPKLVELFVPVNGSTGKIYLFYAEYGVNSDDHYLSILAHMFIESWLSIISIISNDALYFVFAEHACALFEIVGENLKRVCSNETIAEDSKGDINYMIICRSIDLHKEAIIGLIDSFYNVSLLAIFGASLLALSVTGLQVLMHLNEPGELVRFVSFAIAQIFHLYLNSVPGQKIMDHSLSIFNYAYSVDWHNLTPKAQKLLILIMIRSLRPCQITAGKIYIVTMENYSAIMQTSMSFFTVLSSMR